jgi:transcription-repair coupling factor (superfamily II helicase)
MISLRNKIFNSPSFVNFPIEKVKEIELKITGLTGSLKSFFISYLNKKLKNPIVFITSNSDSAEKLYEDIQQISPDQIVHFIPNIENNPYDEKLANPSLLKLKTDALQSFIENNNDITIITANALFEKSISPESLVDHQIFLENGKEIIFNNFIELLIKCGFKRKDIVEDVGQFSVRGGIIDVYTWNYDEPIRLEFFGDQLESIRYFNIITQRSINETNKITIIPSLIKNKHKSSVFDYINEKSVFVVEDTLGMFESLNEYFSNINHVYQTNLEQDIILDEPIDRYLDFDKIKMYLDKKKLIRLDILSDDNLESFKFNSSSPPTFAANIKRFNSYILKNEELKNETYIQCDSLGQRDRLIEILENEDKNYYSIISVGTLHNGFILNDLNLHVITDHEIFDRFKRKKIYKRFKNGEYLRSLKSLTLDDYVVHIDYGIGKYCGLSIIESNGIKKECIKIEFAEGDNLFVSIDRLNRVQKFKSDGDFEPRLTKLGTGEWEKLKKKTKESVQIVAAELLQLYAERKSKKGFAFSPDNQWQKELEASFPFEETEDQYKSIVEVKTDLEKPEPMDRLLCGDVGYGKTEVALRAAFKIVNDGKQAAILVPTTILAYQHYQTFKERLSDFPVNVELLSRFRTKKMQKESIEKLEQGTIDIIIGTHRLLSEDVKFKDLGLLVIDEEQRFGVKHKEKLKKLKVTVDVLTMTATPIPRTMHLSLMGSRDLSHIETPPRNRLPVITEIHEWNEEFIRQIIQRELDRNGQVYFVHNRVKTIAGIQGMIESILPKARVVVAHGQLPESKLEKIMYDFIHKKYDVLVSTMIIENGLDIPNVNSIIIDHADKFGLAQLYQLRGRVGRSDKQAFAYLFIRYYSRINELAKRRLRAIQDFTELGSGFKLALRDLEIRGAGNILGKEQSGYIQSVGFDLYCKILDETVSNLRSDKKINETYSNEKRRTDPKLDVDYDLVIPKDFIFDETERITIYHRLVNLKSMEEINILKSEITDRFGQIPLEVIQLIDTIELKILAGKLFASHLILKQNILKMYFSEKVQKIDSFYTKIIPKFMNETKTKIQFINRPDKLGIEIKLLGYNNIDKINFAKNLLKYI